MPNEVPDPLRVRPEVNSAGPPTSSQAEQHPRRSELVRYLRRLNQWLEWDIHERRAHLEQTHNQVIPSLNRIVQDMDLRRDGTPPGVVRSPHSPDDPRRPRSPDHPPRRPYSPPRPRSPYEPHRRRPHSPYHSRRARSPHDLHRHGSRYDPRHGPSRRDYYGPTRSGRHDPYEDEWRRRPRSRSSGRSRRHDGYEYRSRRYSPEYRGPRRRSRGSRERTRPRSRDSREDSQRRPPAYSPPHSPVDRYRSPRDHPRRPHSPEYEEEDHRGGIRSRRSSEYNERDRDSPRHPSRSRSSHDSPSVTSPSHATVQVLVQSGPSDSSLAGAERERQNRFAKEPVATLERTVEPQDREETHEENHSANEEEWERVSAEDTSKHTRDKDVEQPRQSIWKKLRDRLRIGVSRPNKSIPIGSEPSTSPTPTGRRRTLRRWHRRPQRV